MVDMIQESGPTPLQPEKSPAVVIAELVRERVANEGSANLKEVFETSGLDPEVFTDTLHGLLGADGLSVNQSILLSREELRMLLESDTATIAHGHESAMGPR